MAVRLSKLPDMKYILPIVVSLLFFSCGGTDTNAKNDSVNKTVEGDSAAYDSPIGGTYSFGTDPAQEACGTVMIYPESDSTFVFWIDFTRGAPSYNMAQLEGIGEIVGDTGIYYADYPDTEESCKIKFYFKKDFVQLENTERDCGFGANCMIDHVYNRVGTGTPTFYINAENDTVYFRDLTNSLK